MRRIITLVVAVLLICGTASANMSQGECFLAIAAETQAQLGGIGIQDMSNAQMVSQNQVQAELCKGVQQESQTGIVAQGGSQAGKDATLLQGQCVVVGAGQGQNIDPGQGEGLLLNLNQGQARLDGAGAQVLGQGAVVAQVQTQATSTDFQSQGEFGGGAQFAAQAGVCGIQLQEQNLTVVAGQDQNI